MRILHTADWHVGKTLAGRTRAPEHEAVLDEIADVARRHEVDLVAVAGDLFDSAAPSAEAERIVYRALLALADIAPVLAIAGNHDNERRLAAVAPVFAQNRVTVAPSVTADSCIEYRAHGGERARIALLPWLSQRHVVGADELMSQEAFEHAGTYAQRVRRIITVLSNGFSDDAVNLFVAHATIAGARHGGGERIAQSIFDYWIDVTAFPADAHAALLGHMHEPQRIAGPCPIHYCGSPLHLDFSDSEAPRSVTIVEAAPGVPAELEAVELTAGRKLRTLTGTLAELESLAGTTGDDYLRVKVREPRRVGLAEDVRELFPQTVKVVVEAPEQDVDQPGARVDPAASPHDLFVRYLEARAVSDPALVALFDEIYEDLHETQRA